MGLVSCGGLDCGICEVLKTVSQIINWLFSVSAAVAILLLVIGGYYYISARGNREKMESAKNILFKTVVGFAIALLAWVIIHSVFKVMGVKGSWWSVDCTTVTSISGNLPTKRPADLLKAVEKGGDLSAVLPQDTKKEELLNALNNLPEGASLTINSDEGDKAQTIVIFKKENGKIKIVEQNAKPSSLLLPLVKNAKANAPAPSPNCLESGGQSLYPKINGFECRCPDGTLTNGSCGTPTNDWSVMCQNSGGTWVPLVDYGKPGYCKCPGDTTENFEQNYCGRIIPPNPPGPNGIEKQLCTDSGGEWQCKCKCPEGEACNCIDNNENCGCKCSGDSDVDVTKKICGTENFPQDIYGIIEYILKLLGQNKKIFTIFHPGPYNPGITESCLESGGSWYRFINGCEYQKGTCAAVNDNADVCGVTQSKIKTDGCKCPAGTCLENNKCLSLNSNTNTNTNSNTNTNTPVCADGSYTLGEDKGTCLPSSLAANCTSSGGNFIKVFGNITNTTAYGNRSCSDGSAIFYTKLPFTDSATASHYYCQCPWGQCLDQDTSTCKASAAPPYQPTAVRAKCEATGGKWQSQTVTCGSAFNGDRCFPIVYNCVTNPTSHIDYGCNCPDGTCFDDYRGCTSPTVVTPEQTKCQNSGGSWICNKNCGTDTKCIGGSCSCVCPSGSYLSGGVCAKNPNPPITDDQKKCQNSGGTWKYNPPGTCSCGNSPDNCRIAEKNEYHMCDCVANPPAFYSCQCPLGQNKCFDESQGQCRALNSSVTVTDCGTDPNCFYNNISQNKSTKLKVIESRSFSGWMVNETTELRAIAKGNGSFELVMTVLSIDKESIESAAKAGAVAGQPIEECPDLINHLSEIEGKSASCTINSQDQAKTLVNDGLTNTNISQFSCYGNLITQVNSICGSIPDAPIAKKPAIYLYPEKQEKVTVSLDINGNILKSDPGYPASGWEVSADPSGLIDGKYPYLFYENTLNQLDLPAEGWVVAQSDLKQWFDENLTKLGLNKKESAEFKDYWLAELPSANYYSIRLLSDNFLKENMGLSINPKPDTIIRRDFYFEPLNEKIELKEPAVITPARQGFTVVEWGGILDK